jgi:hypothetical protein
MLPTWASEKKLQARRDTVINPYRELFSYSLPLDQQYWTLGGQCATDGGEPLNGCEFWQMTTEGLITREQFHSVEIDLKIHALNDRAYLGTNWYYGDFYDVMAVAAAAGRFNPGIVNVDLTCTPDGPFGVSYVSKILALLSDTSSQVLVIVNFALKVYSYKLKDGSYVRDLFEECPQYEYTIEMGNWTFYNRYYDSFGSAYHDRTTMGSFHFVLGDRIQIHGGHDCNLYPELLYT